MIIGDRSKAYYETLKIQLSDEKKVDLKWSYQ